MDVVAGVTVAEVVAGGCAPVVQVGIATGTATTGKTDPAGGVTTVTVDDGADVAGATGTVTGDLTVPGSVFVIHFGGVEEVVKTSDVSTPALFVGMDGAFGLVGVEEGRFHVGPAEADTPVCDTDGDPPGEVVFDGEENPLPAVAGGTEDVVDGVFHIGDEVVAAGAVAVGEVSGVEGTDPGVDGDDHLGAATEGVEGEREGAAGEPAFAGGALTVGTGNTIGYLGETTLGNTGVRAGGTCGVEAGGLITGFDHFGAEGIEAVGAGATDPGVVPGVIP